MHNHQPVGNFDFIFERAYQRAYRPFLDVLKAHRGITVSLHFSGILLEWLEKHAADYVNELGMLVREGRVEILGGAYYEAVLPSIPDRDKAGQLLKLQNAVHRVFGVRPQGAWLAERVWEPGLAECLAEAGFSYVVLDGHHLKLAGCGASSSDGWFITEEGGKSLRVLPIDDVLRDLIPFRPVEEVMAHLRSLDKPEGTQIVFGDDGEKLGDWPFTHETVYESGWLESFFSALEASPDQFKVQSLCRAFAPDACRGLVYLPPASYPEMGIWAQNTEDMPAFRRAQALLTEGDAPNASSALLPGRSWRQFLTKYPESNAMHKQMLRLSAEVAESAALHPEAAGKAREALWQSQCNCAYWHGVFGGLYLPHLRNAVYQSLIRSQKALDGIKATVARPVWESRDWNFDGHLEHTLNTPLIYLSFNHRAEIDQFWLKTTGFNLCDTLMRRPEAYHQDSGESGAPDTAELIYDREPKAFCADRFLPPGFAFEPYRLQEYPDNYRFEVREALTESGAGFEAIRFSGVIRDEMGGIVAEMEKSYRLSEGHTLDVGWRVLNLSEMPFGVRVVSELLFCLLAGWSSDRFLRWAGVDGKEVREMPASDGEMDSCRRLEVVDLAQKIRFTLRHDGSGTWRYGQQTVSRSESGSETVYQGTVVLPVFDVDLAPRAACSQSISIRIEEEVAL